MKERIRFVGSRMQIVWLFARGIRGLTLDLSGSSGTERNCAPCATETALTSHLVSRYLNAVSGRFIAGASRPTDRPTPVGTTKSWETVREPREFIRRLTRLKLWHLN